MRLIDLRCSSQLLLASALLATAVGCQGAAPEPTPLEPRALHGFEGCEDMLDYTQTHALELLNFDGYGWEFFEPGGPLTDDDSAGGEDGGDGDSDGPNFSDTNVQEVGVDEPDLVKTDGERILALAKNQLHFVDATGLVAAHAGALELPEGWDRKLFLAGDRAVVIQRSDVWAAELVEMPELWSHEASWVELTQVIEIDISNPAQMQILRTLSVSGDMVSARKADDRVRLVLRSWPQGLELASWWDFYEGDDDEPGVPSHEGESGSDSGGPGEPEPAPDPFRSDDAPESAAEAEAKAKAKAHNEAVLAASTPEHWLPQFVLETPEGTSMGLLYDCDAAMRPGLASGLGVLSVLTISLDEGLAVRDGTGVFSSGETVYASREGLYVATRPWFDWPIGDDGDIVEETDSAGAGSSDSGDALRTSEPQTSYVHKFDVSDPERADYRASGEIPGYLLNQFSMSEYEGQLRVASTVGFAWDEDSVSESLVTVLHEADGELVLTGQVGGLGLTERIYSVRFIGDIAYVVTFRETDPLYTVDLSDPSAPEVLGELKITGYSAYLHPLDDDHLLGIGQDATEQGQLLGTQVSIFDVSDLSTPTRTHQFTLADGYSEAEYDHHAFLYWAPEQLAVFPMSIWDWDGPDEQPFSGVMALRIDVDSGIEELAAITHPAPADSWAGPPRRSLVIDDTLYTLSELGLMSSSLEDFSELGWIVF